MRIDLATRLQMMNRALDCIVPDSPTEVVDEVITTVFRMIGGQELSQSITTTEKGLAACADGLRLFSAPKGNESGEQIKGPVVHSRIQKHPERLSRYERMFRHRLAMLQIRCGNFDEAIEQWPVTEKVPCA